MKRVIIQLSDLHLRESDSKNVNLLDVSDFFDFLSEKSYENIDELFILFTGDLTFNGFEKEFLLFDKFIEKVKAYCGKKLSLSPKVLLVPGNHDINLSRGQVNVDELVELEKNRDSRRLSLHADEEVKKMGQFYNKFPSLFESDKYISLHLFDNLSFVLINSSPFSMKERKDKEHHFIPKSSFDNLNYDSLTNCLNFALIHHRPDWFEYETASQLNSFLTEKINICFCGHEHIENYMVDKYHKNLIYLNSGELTISNNKLFGSTNVVLIKEDKLATIRAYSYKKGDTEYSVDTFDSDVELLRKQFCGYSQSFKDLFKIDINKDLVVDLSDIFVMPYLFSSSKNEDDIDDINKLLSALENGNRIFIYGRPSSGKNHFVKDGN